MTRWRNPFGPYQDSLLQFFMIWSSRALSWLVLIGDGDWWWWWPECDGDGEPWQIVIVIFILIDMNGVLSIWLIFQSCTVPGQAGRGVMGKLKNLHSKVKLLFRFFYFWHFNLFLYSFLTRQGQSVSPFTHIQFTQKRCVFYIVICQISWNTCFWPKAQFAKKNTLHKYLSFTICVLGFSLAPAQSIRIKDKYKSVKGRPL